MKILFLSSNTAAVSSRANKQLYSTWIYEDRFRKPFEIYLFFLCLSLQLVFISHLFSVVLGLGSRDFISIQRRGQQRDRQKPIGFITKTTILPFLCPFLHHYDVKIRREHLAIHRSTDPSIHRSVNLAIHRSSDPQIHQSIDQSMQRSIDPQIHRSSDPTIQQSIYLAIHQSTNPPIHQSTNPPIHRWIA